MFGGMVATGENSFCTSGSIPMETTKWSGDSVDSVEFVDPQCELVVNDTNVNPLEAHVCSTFR